MGHLSAQGIQSRVRLPRRSARLTGGGLGPLHTSLDIRPFEVITLAWAFGGFAHIGIKGRYLGFLMTLMLRL
jgi:hypothetical protein